jgi:tRNA A-37 threonylcarbamoyl transferase component Bud32
MIQLLAAEREISLKRMRWQVMPEVREILLGPDGLRFDDWKRQGVLSVVKHGPHRTVYRVELPGLNFYLKHYRLANTRAWLRELVRSSKARMEYDRALAVASRGVPTVYPLGLGEEPSWTPGESCLLTRTLEDAEPLNQFIESTLPTFAQERQAVLRHRLSLALAHFLALMHNRGICHHDLHAGNVLIRLTAADQPYLYLIDLHAVQLSRPLDWHARRENLVLLNRYFSLRAQRSDRLRFWSEYCLLGRSGRTGKQLHAKARHLESLTWASNLHLWKGRERRCLGNNRCFQRISLEQTDTQVHGMAVTELDHDALRRLLADPDEPFRRPQARLLKDGPSSAVTQLVLAVNGTIIPVIYKRFRRARSWRKRLGDLLGQSKSMRSWVSGNALRERGLPTARPLAVFTGRRGRRHLDGYLVTQQIPDAVELRMYLRMLARLTRDKRRQVLRERIEQLARLIREMHRRRASHRDLKASNILVQTGPSAVPNPGGDFGPFWLIDLVGVRLRGRVERPRRVQNLARLHASFHEDQAISRTDKLRFLRIYLHWGLRGKQGWKRWWHEIARATQAKVIRNQRRQRPLA